MIPRLSAQVNIALRTSAGSWGIAAEIEYRTTDTLFVQLFDPLGRKLAHLEFCGQDYAILAQRSGQFYSGKELPEEVIGFKLPPLDAEDCRLLLLGLIGRKDGMKATVYRNTARPMTMLVGNGENVWTVIYRAYEIVDKIPLPTRISISNSLKNVEIEIQVSNFCAGVRKFQA
jgi:outer membrane biogenesis lipoprotein LolB